MVRLDAFRCALPVLAEPVDLVLLVEPAEAMRDMRPIMTMMDAGTMSELFRPRRRPLLRLALALGALRDPGRRSHES